MKKIERIDVSGKARNQAPTRISTTQKVVAFSLVELRGLKRTTLRRFTLIELLVVIAIIAILAAMLLPALRGGVRVAKSARKLLRPPYVLKRQLTEKVSPGPITYLSS